MSRMSSTLTIREEHKVCFSCRDAGTQGHRDTETQGHRDTETPSAIGCKSANGAIVHKSKLKQMSTNGKWQNSRGGREVRTPAAAHCAAGKMPALPGGISPRATRAARGVCRGKKRGALGERATLGARASSPRSGPRGARALPVKRLNGPTIKRSNDQTIKRSNG